MDPKLHEILTLIQESQKDLVATVKNLLQIVTEQEQRIYKLEQKNG